jgi:SAM-dependent methyltransferase
MNEQMKLWNGRSGHAWVDAQAVLDAMFKPLEDLLVEAAVGRRRVLDVGCGTGSTTLAVTRRLGAQSQCVGIDISEPMLALARARAERETSSARFVLADAQSYAFEPASFDLMISRFGVMFFDDFVRAFANLRRAASEGADMRFIVWRSPAENPFMTTAERAAAPLLPNMPPRRPDGPGQFALADPKRVSGILEASGWSNIDLQPVDVTCSLPQQELGRYVTRLGPVGQILSDVDESTRARVTETVLAAFAPYVQGTEVRFTAACWMVKASASGTR